jgi:hypothetical protein
MPMQTLTFFEVSEIVENELQVLKNIQKNNLKEVKPRKSAVDFITNYSKAYSVRTSNMVGYIENILN